MWHAAEVAAAAAAAAAEEEASEAGGVGSKGRGRGGADDDRVKLLHRRLVGQRRALWEEIEDKMVRVGIKLFAGSRRIRCFRGIFWFDAEKQVWSCILHRVVGR